MFFMRGWGRVPLTLSRFKSALFLAIISPASFLSDQQHGLAISYLKTIDLSEFSRLLIFENLLDPVNISVSMIHALAHYP